ncbi:MAG: aspartate kinase [Clostridia bacterium]|nr:aspartate kinase [Clostridia bacterium]
MSYTQTKVTKFGGTSLADAHQIKKVAEIIRADASRRFVVPSAPGKRFSADIKVTDLLYSCCARIDAGEDYSAELGVVRTRFETIVAELGIQLDLAAEFDEIARNIAAGCGTDYVVSRGEYLSGKVLSALLGFEFVDAAEVVFFDENGKFDSQKTDSVMSVRLSGCATAVIPGFYGALPDGRIKTFSRGGSDISGSIVAKAVMADLYENWTDVSGFLMADPRIVDHPRTIRTITYRELRELSYMGAGVLHEDAVFPVRVGGIPINIRNTNDPSAPGTMIVPKTEEVDLDNVITGLAGKKGFCIVMIEKEMMNSELGFGRRVLQEFEKSGINFEHMPSGIDSLCVIVNEHEIAGKEQKLLNDITEAVSPDMIRIERGLALIAVVGRAMRSSVGTAARVFRCIASEGINIRMIDQGSSELNIILGVDEKDFETAINCLYHGFVK